MDRKQWLVMVDQTFDNIPIRIFDSESEARRFALQQGPEVEETIVEAMSVATSDSVQVVLIEFLNGVPVGRELVQAFD